MNQGRLSLFQVTVGEEVEPFRSLPDNLAEEVIFFCWNRHALAKPLRSLPAGRLNVSDLRK